MTFSWCLDMSPVTGCKDYRLVIVKQAEKNNCNKQAVFSVVLTPDPIMQVTKMRKKNKIHRNFDLLAS